MQDFGKYKKKKKRKTMTYKIICIFFTLCIFFRLTLVLFNIREGIFRREYNAKYEHLYQDYYSSQYVQKVNPNIIPDNALEAFAGGIFLKGLNPILIVHDQPPLGRYFISLSILLFDNASTIPLFLHLFSLVGLFLISKNILKNSLVALLPLAIFVNEPLFLNGFNLTPTLEPIQFPFIVFALYFFIKANGGKKSIFWFILTSIMLGFTISIRFFSLGVVEAFAMIFYFFLKRTFDKKLILFLLTLPLSALVLVLSYTKTIIDGYSIRQIFGIQKYILLYHSSQLMLPFTVWDLLLFNRWHTWWGERSISSDSQWIIAWPIATCISFAQIVIFLFKKIRLNDAEKILTIWVVSYLLFLSFGYSSVRYFLPFIPFLYILAFSFVIKILGIKIPQIKKVLE